MATSNERIAQIVTVLSAAPSLEILRRAFFQLNDDLAQTNKADLPRLRVPPLPSDTTRAALVAAAFAYRFERLGEKSPEWLESAHLVSDTPVYLVAGLDEVTRSLTPAAVSQFNVFVDEASFE